MLKKQHKILIILFILTIISCLLFLFWGITRNNYGYNIPRRINKIIAFIITGSAIGYSTIVFQTVTHNRILTPSIIGLDSIYMFVQTLIVFFLGTGSLVMVSGSINFLVSLVFMLGFSVIVFYIVFNGKKDKLFVTMLAGVVFGSLFGSFSTFMQVVIDPNDFLIVQDKMFASFNNVNVSILKITMLILFLSLVYGYKNCDKLDIMALGRDISLNLGIAYDSVIRKFMILICIMTAVSTALVGPITFLGILTANISRQILKTYKHSIMITGAILLSIISIAFGQFIVERILTFRTTINVIINFIGGIYFIYLLIKEGRL